MSVPSVGIVGGGILGLAAAHRPARRGMHVAVFDASDRLGGMVGTFYLDGHEGNRSCGVADRPSDGVPARACAPLAVAA